MSTPGLLRFCCLLFVQSLAILSRCRSDRCLSLDERKRERQFTPSSSARDSPISVHVNYWEYCLSYTAVIMPIIMLALMNGLVLHSQYQFRRRDNARDRCFQKPGCPTHDTLHHSSFVQRYKRSRGTDRTSKWIRYKSEPVFETSCVESAGATDSLRSTVNDAESMRTVCQTDALFILPVDRR